MGCIINILRYNLENRKQKFINLDRYFFKQNLKIPDFFHIFTITKNHIFKKTISDMDFSLPTDLIRFSHIYESKKKLLRYLNY